MVKAEVEAEVKAEVEAKAKVKVGTQRARVLQGAGVSPSGLEALRKGRMLTLDHGLWLDRGLA
jgi:hypothetical protein